MLTPSAMATRSSPSSEALGVEMHETNESIDSVDALRRRTSEGTDERPPASEGTTVADEASDEGCPLSDMRDDRGSDPSVSVRIGRPWPAMKAASSSNHLAVAAGSFSGMAVLKTLSEWTDGGALAILRRPYGAPTEDRSSVRAQTV